MEASRVQVGSSLAEVERLAKENERVLLSFWAEWCQPAKHMNTVIDELSKTTPSVCFVQLEAEKCPDISEKYAVQAVPFFVFVQRGEVKDTLEGANPPELVKRVKQFSEGILAPVPTTKAQGVEPVREVDDLHARLARLTHYAPVMLFMKGTPDAPKCGFSRKIVELLNKEEIKFSSFDILKDSGVREGLKAFSNWPTYPQLYVEGKLVGGLDIVKELQEEGELKRMTKEGPKEDLNERLSKLINQAPVMLFMKGTPEAPRCGFSSRMVALLKGTGVAFSSFDILADETAREGLKKLSNWPTFPQLYAKGKLVGGLDIATELHEEGELLALLEQ